MPPWHRLSAWMAADESSAVYYWNVCHTAWNQQLLQTSLGNLHQDTYKIRCAGNRYGGWIRHVIHKQRGMSVNSCSCSSFCSGFACLETQSKFSLFGCSWSHCILRTHSAVGHYWVYGRPSPCVPRSPQPTALYFFPVLAGRMAPTHSEGKPPE